MRQYQELMAYILDNGFKKADRTGTGTYSVFGHQMRFDLQEGFPVVTTKKLHLRSIIHELLWFLKGDTNIGYLRENKVRIWDEWADADGELGPVYGAQWRAFPKPGGGEVDQIAQLVEQLKTYPDSRRHIVCAWNPGQIEDMALPPCHCLFQMWVGDGKLHCQLYQRSADFFLGVPFNIASYSLLTHMVAHQIGLDVGTFVWTGGDIHLYTNHVEQAKLQLTRSPRALPKLEIARKPEDLFSYRFEDFSLVGYDPYPTIKAPISV